MCYHSSLTPLINGNVEFMFMLKCHVVKECTRNIYTFTPVHCKRLHKEISEVEVSCNHFHFVSLTLCAAIHNQPTTTAETTAIPPAGALSLPPFSDGRIHPCEHDESDSAPTGFLNWQHRRRRGRITSKDVVAGRWHGRSWLSSPPRRPSLHWRQWQWNGNAGWLSRRRRPFCLSWSSLPFLILPASIPATSDRISSFRNY